MGYYALCRGLAQQREIGGEACVWEKQRNNTEKVSIRPKNLKLIGITL